MSRGRHRHSPPLHRLLPLSAIAGVSVVCALGPWVFSEAVVLRGLAAAAAVTAAGGAVVMRRWDVQAGKRVAELTRARASDEWRHEERVAELETDLEESRELRGKLEQRLRAKRAELAGLRNEHAALLRRYATAQAERASALEGRRLLEIEAATPARALPPAAEEGGQKAVEEKPAVPAVFSAEGGKLFQRAHAALARLAPQASEPSAEAEGSGDRGDDGDGDGSPKGGGGVPKSRAAEPAGDAAGSASQQARGQSEVAADGHEREAAHTTGAQASNSSGHFAVPSAVAVAPQQAPVRRPVTGGAFDFFGTSTDARTKKQAEEAVQDEDLADVVGQEALESVESAESADSTASAESADPGDVVDLTAHDETEHLDVQGLRSAAS